MKNITLILILLSLNFSAYSISKELIELFNKIEKVAPTNIEQAEIYARQALSLSIKEKNNEAIAMSYSDIGLCKYYIGEKDSAGYYHEKAIVFFKKTLNKKALANAYNSMALVKSSNNEHEEAISLYNKALDINIQQKDSFKIAMNYVNIGITYSNLNDQKSAIKYYEKALSLNVKKFDIQIYTNIGICYSSLGEKEKTIEIYQKALKLAEKENKENEVANLLNNIASIYIEKNKLLEAEKMLQKSIKITKRLKDNKRIMHTYMLLGKIKQKQKKYSKALSIYFSTLEMLDKYIDSGLEYKILKNISEIYSLQNKNKKALEYYKKYTILKDSVESKESFVKVSELQAKYKLEKQKNKISKLESENKIEKLNNTKKNFVITAIISVILFLILISLIFFLRYRNNQQKAKHNLEKQGFELEQRMLRSQMNPHFIFNALNSIQSFIATNNTLNAEIFLSKFALLIRNILENSSQKFVDFSKEIKTLDLYIQLEKLRFNNSFEYEIIDNLEDNYLKIPPMLIQPIVENAILHGLRNKQENGKLTIEFNEFSDNEIICNVTDNGIGRKASAEINSVKKAKHNSVATKLTNDRLDFFSESKVSKSGIKFVDLFDNNNKPTGTKVEIIMPFQIK